MSFLRRLLGGGRSVDPVYLNMRKIVLTISPASQGLAPTAELPHVYGACLDWALADGLASVVCLADGSTSLYTSTVAGSSAAAGTSRSSPRTGVCLSRSNRCSTPSSP